MREDEAIPGEVVDMPDMDRCGVEGCMKHAKWGGVFCEYHSMQARIEEKRAWDRKRRS